MREYTHQLSVTHPIATVEAIGKYEALLELSNLTDDYETYDQLKGHTGADFNLTGADKNAKVVKVCGTLSDRIQLEFDNGTILTIQSASQYGI